MNGWRRFLLAAALAAAAPALALDAAQQRSERERIEAERAQADAEFQQREQECRQRFVVTSCVEGARRDRRQALERLRRQEEVLEADQRKQRAAQRMDDIRNKVSGDDAKARDTATRERRRQKQRAKEPPAAAPASAASAAR